MSTLAPPPRTRTTPTVRGYTVRDLTDRFGPIPLDRFVWDPLPGTATFADLLRLHDAGRLVELVDGVLLEKAVGWTESRIAILLAKRFGHWDPTELLGTLTGADGFVRLANGNTRGPDLSFYAWDSLPGRRLPADAVPELCPDFCVEVVSRSNTRREIDGRLDDLFASGCRLAWVLDPRPRTARLITPAQTNAARPWVEQVVRGDAVLNGEPVLPGFEVRLDELWAAGPGEERV